MRTYIALSVYLYRVPKEHVAPNGSRQFAILVRSNSQRAVAALLGTSLSQMRNFNGIHEFTSDVVSYNKFRVADIVKKDNTVYYEWNNAWYEYPQ
jgi:hypothetical protein